MKQTITILFLTFILTACSTLTGEEIARLEINSISKSGNITSKEATLTLKKGDEISFWSDMDMEYKGEAKVRFKVKVYVNKTKIKEIEIDPTNKNITIGEVKTVINKATKWKFTGKNYKMNIKKDETYTFKSILVASENSSLKINKAELVIKK